MQTTLRALPSDPVMLEVVNNAPVARPNEEVGSVSKLFPILALINLLDVVAVLIVKIFRFEELITLIALLSEAGKNLIPEFVLVLVLLPVIIIEPVSVKDGRLLFNLFMVKVSAVTVVISAIPPTNEPVNEPVSLVLFTVPIFTKDPVMDVDPDTDKLSWILTGSGIV